jgi:putative tryptophan/tyrosine transport system substrate-binding protein
MHRRAFLGTLTGSLLAAPLAAEAQQATRVYRVAFLGSTSASGYADQLQAFREGLRALGYVEGQNLVIEFRWAEAKNERLPELAAELVRLKPDVLVTHGTPGILAAKRATRTIPIVMGVVGEAVAIGAVETVARPGGNVTGSSFFVLELMAKRLELLREVLPRLNRVGVLLKHDNPLNVSTLKAMEHTARQLKLLLRPVEVRDAADLENAVAGLAKERAGALALFEEAMLIAQAGRIADLAIKHHLPTIGFIEYTRAGGLLAYGVNFPDLWRRAASFVDKILRGAKPESLPIEQSTKFDLVINLKTAKALGLTIPPSLLQRADQVIE